MCVGGGGSGVGGTHGHCNKWGGLEGEMVLRCAKCCLGERGERRKLFLNRLTNAQQEGVKV